MKRGCSCGTITLVFLAIIAGFLFWIAYPIYFGEPQKREDTAWPESLILVPRGEWGSVAISNPEEVGPMSGIRRVTIHHDGMPPLPMKTDGQIKSRIVSIRKAHSKKYADIGYHFIVDPLGRIWEGRPVEFEGAHVQGHNSNNIGILFLGNTYEDVPTPEALEGLYRFLRYLRLRYDINEEDIKTHRELAQTGCPGKYLQTELDKARKSGTLKIKESSGFPIDIVEVITKIEEFVAELMKMIKSS